MRLLSTLISRQLLEKLPRCLTPVCHDITLPSNITCSVSLTDSPYLIQIVFCALKLIKLLVAILTVFPPNVSLYQYYMIVLHKFGVHYAQRYTLLSRVCVKTCSIIDSV